MKIAVCIVFAAWLFMGWIVVANLAVRLNRHIGFKVRRRYFGVFLGKEDRVYLFVGESEKNAAALLRELR